MSFVPAGAKHRHGECSERTVVGSEMGLGCPLHESIQASERCTAASL